MAEPRMILVCDDPLVSSGAAVSECPASEQVWVSSEFVPVGSELSQGDVGAIASAAATLFVLAFAFRIVRKTMQR